MHRFGRFWAVACRIVPAANCSGPAADTWGGRFGTSGKWLVSLAITHLPCVHLLKNMFLFALVGFKRNLSLLEVVFLFKGSYPNGSMIISLCSVAYNQAHSPLKYQAIVRGLFQTCFRVDLITGTEVDDMIFESAQMINCLVRTKHCQNTRLELKSELHKWYLATNQHGT